MGMEKRISMIERKLAELGRNEKLSRDRLQELQRDKFRRLAEYAVNRSPYYAKLAKSEGIDWRTCTPSDFPVLTKPAYMEHFDEIVTDRRITKAGVQQFLLRASRPLDLHLDEFRVIHSSGTSGLMGYFIYSRGDWERGMAQALRSLPFGNAVRERRVSPLRVAYYGTVRAHLGGTCTLVSLIEEMRAPLALRMYDVTDSLTQTIRALNDFKPEVVCGYTQSLIRLAEEQKGGRLCIAPRTLQTVGEGMSTGEQEYLEGAFAARATNGYASSEHLMMGVRVPGTQNCLLMDDDLIFELYEDRSIVTNLFNYTTPLIRYRMCDVLVAASNRRCPHLPYLEVDAIIGRTDVCAPITNEEGETDSLDSHSLGGLLVAGVTRFQLEVVAQTAVKVRMTVDSALDVAARERAIRDMDIAIGELLFKKRMRNVSWETELCKELSIDCKSGKFRRIICSAEPTKSCGGNAPASEAL